MSSIGIEIPFKDLPASDTVSATLEYREDGASTWLPALPLRRIRPDLGGASSGGISVRDALAGSVLFLDAGKTWNARAIVTDSRQGYTQVFQSPDDFPHPVTQSEPRANPTNRIDVNVTPATVQNAIDNAIPGHVIILANGVYPPLTINAGITLSGDAVDPIFLRGLTRTGVIVDALNGTGINFTGGSGSAIRFWTVEDLTIINANVGVRIMQSDTQTAEDIVVRRTEIFVNTGQEPNQVNGSAAIEFRWGTKRRIHTYDNLLMGQEPWGVAGNGATFGIHYSGQGNSLHHNTIAGFGDSISSTGVSISIANASTDIWRNDILWSTDDAIELDDQQRNVRCYENRITNAKMGISIQPSLGGPIYIVRNFMYNMIWAPFKFKESGGDPNGFLAYHNTCVKGDGLNTVDRVTPIYEAWQNGNSASWYQFEIVNNLFAGPRSAGSYTISCSPEPYGGQWRIDGNGYWPQGRIRYDGTVTRDFASIEAAIGSGQIEANGRRIIANSLADIFSNIGNDPAQPWYTTQADPRDPSLHTLSSALNASITLDNVGHTDLGCIPFGGAVPDYGRRVGPLEIV